MVSQHSEVGLHQQKKEKFEATCSKDVEQCHLWVTE
jgi:hypothetical protein